MILHTPPGEAAGHKEGAWSGPRTENVRRAREIVAGSRGLTAPELMELAAALAGENQIGYARRVYREAWSLAPPELRDRIQLKVAFATYEDPDLPMEYRLEKAETLLLEILARADSLPIPRRQETLGMLGGVYKQRWRVSRPQGPPGEGALLLPRRLSVGSGVRLRLYRPEHRVRARRARRRRARHGRRAQRSLPEPFLRGVGHPGGDRHDAHRAGRGRTRRSKAGGGSAARWARRTSGSAASRSPRPACGGWRSRDWTTGAWNPQRARWPTS